jgi:heat shock protein HtpX
MTLYTHQSENVRKTWFLMTGFLVILIAVGWALSYYYRDPVILVIFAIVSIVMNIVAYWQSDKIALSQAHAIPADGPEYLELNRVVENLAITAGLPKPRVYIINDPAPNAFATGRDPEHAAVAVTTGLIDMMDRSELEGVIAHELSHIGNRDILVATVVVVLVGLLAMISDFFVRSMIWGGGRKSDNDRGDGNGLLMVLGFIAIILAPIVATLIQLAVSRKREFLADASGALLTRYPEGLASALKKIDAYSRPMEYASSTTAHLYIANPFGKTNSFMNKLFATHPPIPERVSALLDNK